MIKGIFKSAFPFISSAASLGGPLGVMAANIVGKAIGVEKLDPSAIEDAIAVATSKDPELMLRLKETEQQFQLQMTQLGFDNAAKIEEIHAQDRASARTRETIVKDWTPRVLAGVVVCMTFLGEGILLTYGIPTNTDGVLVGRILGTLDSALMLILSYYFGSSAGSAEKTKLMANGHAKG